MASNPPFFVEDQTDEDFFDKLVNDDDDFQTPSTSAPLQGFADGSDSDDIKTFANLRVGDVITRFEDTGRQSGGAGAKQEDAQELLAKSDVKPLLAEEPRVQKKTGSLVSFDSSGFDGMLESNDGSIGAEVDSSASKNSGSTNSGAKEVQWSAFNTDLTQNGNNGFGSYSDIFGELGDGNVNTENNWTYGSEVSSGTETRATLDLGNSYKYGQHQDGISYDAGKEQLSYEQDLNSSQYWDSLYPGWKYDPNTGQWYQLDGYDPATSVQGGANSNLASDWSVSDVKPEVSYYQQSSESVVGTVEHTLMTEGVNNLKQVSEMCGTSGGVSNWSSMPHENNYPSHMVFDPQYPGWYYDTIAQEWRSLESYASSADLAAQAQNKQAKSDFSSRTLSHETDPKIYSEFANATNYVSESFASQSQDYNLGVSFGNNKQPGSNVWQSETQSQSDVVSKPLGSQRLENPFPLNKNVGQLNSYSYEQENQGHNYLSASTGAQGFSSVNFNQQFNQPRTEQMEHMNVSDDYYVNQNSVNFSQQAFQSAQQFSYAATSGRSSAGCPPHALVTFGFGGKLIVMKGNNNFNSSSYANQDAGTAISVLNLTEVVTGKGDASSIEGSVKEYFWTLCRQSFPGPLAGGNVGMKELNKWIDERIAQCEAPYVDYNKGKLLRLLLSLLKIACQHYGKLRSPFSADGTSKEIDEAETAVARLFASAGRNGLQFSEYDALAHCLHKLPSEAQMRATAAEVQGLLVSGRKKEALYRAQEGQLWGPALVLATQLGDQFYIDTVKQMALRQLVAGSPLRTLCLLIAGQPAEVFSSDNSAVNSISSSANMSQQTGQLSANGMLDDWEENLAVIASNRTKDDDLVLIHLGDCLWKERSKIVAAHICYLVAEANFEPFSDSARFCLVGADHWKFPRTYASPEAIQRTEVYEYSKVLGNSQFVLLAFQPYRLVYAHMLAEVGRVSDSLKYCQAVFKSLKTGRSPEVETWRQLASSLEERIRTHQQGGFSTNLAPAKLMGKLLNLFDSTTHLVVGGLPPLVPAPSVGNVQGNELYQLSSGLRVSSSQSTMAMSSLMPSTSVEPISERMADGSKMTMYSRSVSEPDFGRSPRQKQADSSKEVTSVDAQVKASGGTSRFGRFGFGSQLFQKTVGLVLKPRKDRQAKLGETNKFYYDEKLKRWVEEGVEPPPEEAALPPPPTSGSFQNGMADYNLNNALESEGSFSNGVPEIKSPFPVEHGSGIPPIPLTSNQFSARGRMGVRSRYVDTFNKGGASPATLFQSPSVPSAKTSVGSNPKFFVPTPASSVEQPVDSVADSTVEENHSTSMVGESYKSLAPSSAMSMQRFASMDNIPNNETGMKYNGSVSSLSRRTASWSGSFTNASTPSSRPEAKPLEEVLGMPPLSVMGNDSSLTRPSVDVSFRDELQEVEL